MLFFLSQNGQWNDAICQNPADGFICKKPMTLMSATPAPEVVGCTYVSHTGVLMYSINRGVYLCKSHRCSNVRYKDKTPGHFYSQKSNKNCENHADFTEILKMNYMNQNYFDVYIKNFAFLQPSYGYGSFCYRFVYQSKTWKDAQTTCVNAFHGSLAAINDRSDF